MKVTIGILLTSIELILGIVGILMKGFTFLPPALQLPSVQTLILLVGIILTGIGLNDELEGGTKGLIDLIKMFFTANPYRNLLLTAVLFIAKNVIALPDISTDLKTAAQLVLALAAVFGFSSAYATYKIEMRIQLYKARGF